MEYVEGKEVKDGRCSVKEVKDGICRGEGGEGWKM